MRIPRLMLLPLAGLVVLVVMGVVFLTLQTNANSTPTVPPEIRQAQFHTGSNTGMTAITPKSNAAIAFSTSDVQAFIQAHGFMGGAVVSGHTLKILSIQLLTPQQADAWGAELTAYTSTKMVYVVKMEGPFHNTNVKTLAGGPSTSLVGYEIFDAHTGNMLEWDATQSVNDGI
jgi:hypothetical protein